MENAGIKNLSTGTKIKWIFTIVLPILLYLIPTNEIYTSAIRAFIVATIFFICLAAFDLIPVLIAGLLLPMLYVLLGATSVDVALSTWSSSFLMWAVIGGFVFAYALDESGLITRFVYWAAVKCKGKFVPLVFTLLGLSFLIQFITFVNSWMILIVLCFGIVEALNLKFTKQGLIIMIIAQITAAMPCVFFYNPGIAAIYQSGVQMMIPDYTMNWLSLPYLGWLAVPITFLIIFIFLKIYKVSKSDLPGGKEYFEEQYAKLGKISKKEKWALLILIIVFLFLATTEFHHIDGNYAFVLFPALFFLPGVNVATKDTLKRIDIGYVIFIASCMGIGTVGGAVGIGQIIAEYGGALLTGWPIPVFLIVCLLFGIALNLLMTPGAMLALMAGPLTALGLQMGIENPLIPAMALYFANELVFLPFENSYVLIVYGFNTMTLKDFMQYNIIKMVLFVILFAAIIIPYWYLIGAI